MTSTAQRIPVDEVKLQAFVGQVVGELGATLGAALVVLGDQLGLYKVREVVSVAGFRRFRRAAETPFNVVLEARP